MTTLTLLTALGQALLVAALTFVVVCLFISHLRFAGLTRRLHTESDLPGSDALRVRVAQALGTAHRNPEPLTIVLLAPAPDANTREENGTEETEELLGLVEQRLRSLVRKRDVVMRYRDHEVALLLQTRRAHADGLVRRLLTEMTRTPYRLTSGAPATMSLQAGAASYPEDGTRAHELCNKADAALAAAVPKANTPTWPADTAAPSQPQRSAHLGPTEPGQTDQKHLLDELTGVLMEKHFGTAMQKYVAQYRREDRPAAIVCLDMDQLSRYNDQYGRATGDRLLKQMADYLQRSTREADLIARYEGDQFVIALSATAPQALTVAQRILTGLRRASFEGGGSGLRLTATLGVAAFPDHGLTAKELFASAQAALKAAKAKGRNQCLLYQEPRTRPDQIGRASDAF